jgi:hypothetical protein
MSCFRFVIKGFSMGKRKFLPILRHCVLCVFIPALALRVSVIFTLALFFNSISLTQVKCRSSFDGFRFAQLPALLALYTLH